jgi:hypothetical protein
MPKKQLSEEHEPRLYLDIYQLDKIHEYAFALEGRANVTKREEWGNIGYTLDVICNGILDLSEEIGKQKLECRGGTK